MASQTRIVTDECSIIKKLEISSKSWVVQSHISNKQSDQHWNKNQNYWWETVRDLRFQGSTLSLMIRSREEKFARTMEREMSSQGRFQGFKQPRFQNWVDPASSFNTSDKSILYIKAQKISGLLHSEVPLLHHLFPPIFRIFTIQPHAIIINPS